MFSRLSLLAALAGAIGLTTYSMLQAQELPRPDVTPRNNTLPLLSGDREQERVQNIADAVTRNDLGYHEASFPNDLTLIFVPAGQFIMGNDDLGEDTTGFPASPAHPVTLSHYWIGKTPVTIRQFRAFVAETGYVTNVELPGHPGPWVYAFAENGFITIPGHKWDNAFHQVTAKFLEITVTDDHPVPNVSWYDCIAYTNWLSEKHGLPFTLPSEAEWEFAARGTDQRIYPWGNASPDGTRANYADETFDRYFPNTGQSIVHKGVNDGFAITSPVGSFPAGRSPIGALDMAGNLTEWVFDTYAEYSAGTQTNPITLNGEPIRMQKAGFWAGSAGRANVSPDELEFGHNIRADARQGDDPASADDHLGCRVAISYTARG